MIDITKEKILTLSEAAAHVPGRGSKRVHVSTLYRWSSRGLRGTKLETIQAGARTCTSLEALQRFFDRLDGGDEGAALPARNGPRKPQDAVERDLDAMGA